MLEQVSPNIANYMRGGTRVYIKRDGESNYVHLGNVVNTTIARDEETQEHITGMDGTKVIDKKRQEIKAINYTIQVDENTIENLRFWMLGGATTAPTQSAVSADATTAQQLIVGSPATLAKGRYYNMRSVAGGEVHNILWDSADLITINGMVEGTDFVVDYVAGRIVFMAAVADASALTVSNAGTLKAFANSSKFDMFDNYQIDCSAEGVHSFEDGDIRDFWTVPKAQLLPSGDSSFNIEEDRVIELQLVQLKDTLLGWGTYQRIDIGS